MCRGTKLPLSICASADFVDCLLIMRNPHETPLRLRNFRCPVASGARPAEPAASTARQVSFVVVQRLESKERVKQFVSFTSPFRRPRPLMWRLLQTVPATGAFNMALDEALMAYARETGTWVLRVYSWSSPTLSLGRNQRARGGYDPTRLAQQHIDVVRRPTGGRAILHDREITYSVAAPVADAGDLRESYARINRLL